MNRALARLKDDFAAHLSTLDGAQTQARPTGRPEAWTVQQIVEHLLLTYSGSVKAIDTRLEKGTATRAKATLKHLARQWTVCTLQIFPTGRAAPETVQPVATKVTMNGQQLCDAFAVALAGLDAKMMIAERSLGKGRCVSHFALGPMSMPQWRRFHLAHGRHHLKQITAILRR